MVTQVLLHKDASIQLYGMHAWACLFPWDPMAMDFPERVTPLLDEEFMAQWAEQDNSVDPLLDVTGTSPVVNLTKLDGGPTRTQEAPRRPPTKRRVANAKARAEVAQKEQQTAESELQAANQRRHGFETWASLCEQRLSMAQELLDETTTVARAAEQSLAEIQRDLDEAREEVELTGTEAEAARKRVEAAGRSIKVARSVRRMRRIREALPESAEAVEDARRREREAIEDLTTKQATLDRALLKTAESTKVEAALQRTVTNARRKAARAALAYADLVRQAEEAEFGERHPTHEVRVVTDIEQAEKEAREAKADLLTAAGEVRSVAEMVAAAEGREKEAQAALVVVHAEAQRADALVEDLEAALADARQQIAEVAPSLAEAEADAEAATDRVEAAGRTFKIGRHAWKLSRARRSAERNAALLEEARAEAATAGARLEEATGVAEDAKKAVREGRGVEADTRRTLGDAHRRLGSAVGTLSRLRWEAGEKGGGEETFQYLVIARQRAVLGNLALDEWAHRATGHWRVPRFILEKDEEAIWLYQGEWVVADPSLSLDDLAVLKDAPEEVEDEAEGVGATHSLDLEAVQFTWERDGGRCTNCGSYANLVIDHVIPVYLGGGDAASNLQLLCRNCSREKSHRL
jgi:hypothetical protein